MAIFRRRDDRRTQDEEIDLREGEHRPRWGRPTRCPRCGEPGYLDHIDLVEREMRQHCPACHAEWRTAEADCVRPGR